MASPARPWWGVGGAPCPSPLPRRDCHRWNVRRVLGVRGVLCTLLALYAVGMVHLYVLMDAAESSDAARRIYRHLASHGIPLNMSARLNHPECTCLLQQTDAAADKLAKVNSYRANSNTSFAQCHTEGHAPLVDIEVASIVREQRLRYPQYVYNHRGWLQTFELDISYDPRRWTNDLLDVYVVPHSHNDPGWRRTVDTYYTDYTRHTLDHMLVNLQANHELRFVWSEIIYLKRWYESLNEANKTNLQGLLRAGQLEVVTGGWVMPDETVTHYSALIDQLTEGHDWLNRTLGVSVRTAWALDSFGHSPVHAYLLQRAGVQQLMVQRAHYGVKQTLARRQQFEFLWKYDWAPSSPGLLTHLAPFQLYNILYSCGPEPEVCCHFDFTANNCYKGGKYHKPDGITEENIDHWAWKLLDQYRKKSTLFKHNKLLVLHGDDFRFDKADEWRDQFGNLTRLFKYMNSHPNMYVKVRYATLSDYFSAVRGALTDPSTHKLPLPSLTGDFIPYIDRDDQFWTGFYTSRPILKLLVRRLHAHIRATDILLTLAVARLRRGGGGGAVWGRPARGWAETAEQEHRSLGLLQHHDAITGTAKDHVVKDYLSRIKKSYKRVSDTHSAILTTIYNTASARSTKAHKNIFHSLHEQPSHAEDIKFTTITENTTLSVFNPLPFHRNDILRVPIASVYVRIVDSANRSVPCQILPNPEKPIISPVYYVAFGINASSFSMVTYEIYVLSSKAQTTCALSTVEVISLVHKHKQQYKSPFNIEYSGLKPIFIENNLIRASICGCTGTLQYVHDKLLNISETVHVEFVTYGTGSLSNPFKDKSGAYIFMPDGDARPLHIHSQPDVFILRGPVLEEVVTYLQVVRHTTTLYRTGVMRGSVSLLNWVTLSANNTELAMRVQTGVQSGNLFYTDLNGWTPQRRENLAHIPLQGNVYPMTSSAYIEDDVTRLTLHVDHTHGVTSLLPGQLEVFLDRRLMQDDWRGLGQGVTDNTPTPARLVLHLQRKARTYTGPATESSTSHQLSSLINHPVIVSTISAQNEAHKELSNRWRSLSLLPPSVTDLCNLDVINLRLKLDAAERWIVYILLREVVINPCIVSGPDDVICTPKPIKMVLTQLKKYLGATSVTERSLTGLGEPFVHQAEAGALRAYVFVLGR